MKKPLLFSLLLALMLASCHDGLRKEIVSTYDNGQPAKVRYFDKDNQCVREVDYHDNGIVLMEGEIKDGLRSGEWTSYFSDGKVQSTGFYVKGIRSGKGQIFHENGHLWMDGWYKDDHKCGEWIFYDEQGYELERVNYGPCD